MLDALRARNDDDPEAAGELADRAATALTSAVAVRADPDPLLVGLVSTSKGIAAIRAGDLAVAGEDFTEVTSAASPPEPLLTAESEGFLALLACFRGRLSHAAGLASQALAAVGADRPAGRGTPVRRLARPGMGRGRAVRPARRCRARRAGREVALPRRRPRVPGGPGADPVAHRGRRVGTCRVPCRSCRRPSQSRRPTSGPPMSCTSRRRESRLPTGTLGLAEEHLTRSSGRGEAEAVLLEVQLALARGDDLDVEGAQRRAPGLARAPGPGERSPDTGVGTTPQRVTGPRQGRGGPGPPAGGGGEPPAAVPRGRSGCPADAAGRCGSGGSPSVVGAGRAVTCGGPHKGWSVETRATTTPPRCWKT